LMTLSGLLDPIICKRKTYIRLSPLRRCKWSEMWQCVYYYIRSTPLIWRCWTQPDTSLFRQSYRQRTSRFSSARARGRSCVRCTGRVTKVCHTTSSEEEERFDDRTCVFTFVFSYLAWIAWAIVWSSYRSM
jgi:hypothetical protein